MPLFCRQNAVNVAIQEKNQQRYIRLDYGLGWLGGSEGLQMPGEENDED